MSTGTTEPTPTFSAAARVTKMALQGSNDIKHGSLTMETSCYIFLVVDQLT